MAEQLDPLLNRPTVTPSGNVITTTTQNIYNNAKSQAINSTNIIVSSGGDYLAGAAGSVISGVVGQAVAPVIDIAQKGKQVYDLVKNPSLSGALSLLGRGFPPFRNELDQFASYTPIFTFGCLTNLELNYPLSYRLLGPAVKIIKSGGTAGNKIPTIYETDGQVEFFIEDVEILNHCAPSPLVTTSNAVQFKFKVIEPYSMGQWFHSLRTAALVTGHANYVEAPFLLSVAFIGYDDDGNVKNPLFSQRHFPLRLVESQMKVTGAGAEYEITAVPYNSIALIDTVNQVKTDVQLKGSTVAELLQTGAESLAKKLNLRENKLVEAKQKPAADVYVIAFPQTGSILTTFSADSPAGATAGTANPLRRLYESITGDRGGDIPADLQSRLEELGVTTTGSASGDLITAAAEANINSIGAASFAPTGTATTDAATPYQEAGFTQSDAAPNIIAQGRITYNVQTHEMTFRNATAITDIIKEVVLTSEYAREWLDKPADAAGMISIFRIHTEVYNGSSFVTGLSTGQAPKVYVYKVMPYQVPAADVSNNSKGLFDVLTQQSTAVKGFNYIYTGQNNEIVDFDILFNQTFYTGIQASRGQVGQTQQTGGQNSAAQPEAQPIGSTYDDGPLRAVRQTAGPEAAVVQRDTPGQTQNGGSRGGQTATNNAARDLFNSVINSANDMITLDLTIHGDPYFLADSGLGNYLGLTNPTNQAITIDGSMNSVDGVIPVVVNFRTPIDYGEDGWVKYPLGGFLPLSMFSGTYKVILVENSFKKGQFTQKLKLARMKNQDLSISDIAGAIKSAITGTAIGRAIGITDDAGQEIAETQTRG